MKAIIFGITGQDGSFLAQFLAGLSVSLRGISRSKGKWIQGNVAAHKFVQDLLAEYQPDFIFHFAANSTTNHSALFENHEAISTGTLNILESVRLFSPRTRVFLSGSAMQFENNGCPINELTPFAPTSPYAVARIHATYLARYYRERFRTRVYTGYFFNHDSPLRSERHVNQKIAAAACRIAEGSGEKLELGNIDVEKEFNFAGDVIEAVWMLVNQDKHFEAVIGSGESHTIRDWVEYCFGACNLDWRDHVVINAEYRPEYRRLVCEPTLIKSLGWLPKTTFGQLADMMLGKK